MSGTVGATTHASTRSAAGSSVFDYVALLKPRVMSLAVFTAFVGMIAAPGVPDPFTVIASLSLIAAGAGGAAALNMWYDADVDAVMTRTRERPIPSGRLDRSDALFLGCGLSVASVVGMAFMSVAAAAWLAFTIFFYVVVYTMFLKRRTSQNIVIGGAAGAMPPIVGWAAGGGGLDLLPIVLFFIIFVWTPPHFWALALTRTDDYQAAGIPMLPVTAGTTATLRAILLYSVLLAVVAPAPYLIGFAGPVYAACACALSVPFVAAAVATAAATNERRRRRALALFGYSIVYLFAIFALLLADGLARVPR